MKSLWRESSIQRRAPNSHWKAHLAERRNRVPLLAFDLSRFTDRNVIRLGLTTKCPRCTLANWHSLTIVDYVLSCERCSEKYPFPQGALDPNNGNWGYRVLGPFSTPGYARGSYGALFALKALKGISHASERITFSTALELHLGDGAPCEVTTPRGSPIDRLVLWATLPLCSERRSPSARVTSSDPVT